MSLNIIPNPKEKVGNQVFRYGFTENFKMIDNKDWALAVPEEDVDQVPSYLLEIFARFYHLDYIWKYGNQCVKMSTILRRILRLHGYEAHTRQVILTYDNKPRKWSCQVGSPQNFLGDNELDVHMVVVCDGWLLDFSVMNILWGHYGFQAPIAFIAKDPGSAGSNWFEGMQDFGNYGKASWFPRIPANNFVKHWQVEQRDEVKQEVMEYFKIYKMERHDD